MLEGYECLDEILPPSQCIFTIAIIFMTEKMGLSAYIMSHKCEDYHDFTKEICMSERQYKTCQYSYQKLFRLLRFLRFIYQNSYNSF